MTPVRLEPMAPRSQFKHSTAEPLRSNSQFIAQKLFILTCGILCFGQNFELPVLSGHSKNRQNKCLKAMW